MLPQHILLSMSKQIDELKNTILLRDALIEQQRLKIEGLTTPQVKRTDDDTLNDLDMDDHDEFDINTIPDHVLQNVYDN